MPLHIQTPDGAKDLFLRGWKGPRGLKGFTQGRITTPSGDKQFWNKSGAVSAGLTVTLDRYGVGGGQASAAPAFVVTAPSTATAAGGTGPYSYAWTLVSDDGLGGTWTPQYPTQAGTTFNASAVPDGATSVATFRCTATDAHGATGTADCTATATNFGPM